MRNRGKGRLTEQEVSFIAKQLFTSLHYMHQERIVHRDIKLENILIDSRNDGMYLKLTDFGFATFIQPGEMLSKGVGSRYYIAPEILQKQDYDFKIDVWSATIVIYILLCGDMPYPGNNVKEVAESIKQKDLKKELKKLSYLSQEARSFLLAGMEQDPQTRYSSAEMLQHPFLTQTELPKIKKRHPASMEQAMYLVRAGHKVP